MKKILIFLLLVYPTVLIAQPTGGDGSAGNPWTGIITTPWSPAAGNIYFTGAVSFSTGTVTISPGTILYFAALSNLTVSGNAVLLAVGTSNNNITFTASGTSWGHLSFTNTSATTNSILDYCIVEKGSSVNGGGIYTTSSNLRISNSIIRSNTGTTAGGGIYISNASPIINGCTINGNSAEGTNGGGGIFITGATSASSITNCIISNNNSTHATLGKGGGVFLSLFIGSVRFYNCVIVSNTATISGANVYYGGSHSPQFYNSILWGSNPSIGYTNSLAATDFNYSAIQGYSTGYSSCITLNATNNDPTGPNFLNPGSGNYNISLASPCLNTGTLTGAPATDILGNGRILNPDIGAYEVQYANWKTTAVDNSWANLSNWEGAPTTSPLIVIPSGASFYPNPPDVSSAVDFTVGSGVSLILDPGAQVTFKSLTNNGSITLKSNASSMFSLMLGSYSGTGTVNTELYLTGGTVGGNKWHYLTVPATMNKAALTSINIYNLLNYDDSKILATGTKMDGWQWHDGYGTPPTTGFTDLEIRRGYNFYHSNSAGATAVFTSNSLLADLDATLGEPYFLQYSGSADNDDLYGWNLFGNSLTCGINWDNIYNEGRGAVYFTKNNLMAGYVDGAGVNGGSNFIPPLQGYFVKATALGQSFYYDYLPGYKVHTTQTYFKRAIQSDSKSSIIPKPLIRLNLEQGVNKDETVIRFYSDALLTFDAKFDATKWLSGLTIPQLYTYYAGDEYCINTLPFPKITTDIMLAVVIPTDGNYVIKNTLIEGLDAYNIYLKDLQEQQTIDLKSIPEYSFAASAGTIKNRFVISVVNIITGTEVVPVSDHSFNIYSFNGTVNINPLSDDWNGQKGTIRISDLTGKNVIDKKNVEFWKNSLIQLPVSDNKGIYLIEIISGIKRYTGKFIVR